MSSAETAAASHAESQRLLGRLVANFGWLGAQKIAVILIGLATTGIVARHLGPEQMGILGAAQALATMLGVAAMGIDSTVLTSWLLKNPENEDGVMGGTACVLAVTGTLSWIVLCAWAWFIEDGSWIVRVTAIVAGLRMLLMFPAPIAVWFQSRMHTREVVVANTAGTLALRGWQLLCSASGGGVIRVALAEFVCFATVTWFSLRAFYRHGRTPFTWKADWSTGWSIFLQSLPALFAASLVTFLSKVDVIMLRHLAGDAEVGLFNAATSMTESLMFFSGMTVTVFSPVLARSFHHDPERYDRQRRGYMRFTVLLGWLFALGLCLFSGFIIQIVFGAQYSASAGVLAVHGFLIVPAMLGAALQCQLAIEHRLVWLTAMLGMALALDIVLNALLIPPMGAQGAALASVLAAVMAYAIAPLLLPATRALGWLSLKSLFAPFPRRADLAAFKAG